MMVTIILLGLLLAVSLAQQANGSTCSNMVKLSTFNTGLTPQVTGYELRREMIPIQLLKLDTDVICLQEVWFEDDMKHLIDRMTTKGFSHYSTIHHGVNHLRESERSFWTRLIGSSTRSPCATWRTTPMIACYIWSCVGTSRMSLLLCLETNCKFYLNMVPQDCLTCLIMGMSSIPEVFDRCVSSRKFNRFNTQGLLLFSRKRIVRASHQTFQDEHIRQILPRGYIEAQIDDLGTVVCTHFTVNASRTSIEDNLPYNSTESQQADEIDKLHEKFRTSQHIILGDLNTGPYDPNRDLWSDFPNNYQKLKDIGYTSPYDMEGGTCTYCNYNTNQNNRSVNSLVDHILVKGMSYRYRNPQRIFTRRIGKWNLSDHFGLKIEICV